MMGKRPATRSKQKLLVSLLVIALTTVILTTTSTQASDSLPTEQQAAKVSESTAQNQPKEQVAAAPEVAKTEPKVEQAAAADQSPKSAPVPAAESAAAAKPAEEEPAKAAETGSAEANRRKGRAEPAAASSSEKTSPEKPAAEKAAAAKPAESQDAAPKSASKASKPGSLTGKSGSKSKLPANLGTVTSTGSGGPAHYMSKHDAYSAIAEKHGALAQDSMTRKSDKRSQGLQGFAGIQKASGLGDMLSPFRQVTDSGLARTLGASMRSIMKGKYSVPAYVASALLGAVALLAFYESPMSPLPVPPLPESPVGRFPPEQPIIPAGTQVPFRVNNNQQQQYGQQNYNQRSFMGPQQPSVLSNQPMGYQQQQPQQVLFPGQNAQQRQMTSGSSGGPVQQLAANLLSSVAGKPQIAQRKSSVDYDQQSLPRSLFGGSSVMGSAQATGASPKMAGGSASGQQPQQKLSSFLGFFGLGGGSGPSSNSQSTAPTSAELLAQASSPLSSAIAGGQAASTDSRNQVSSSGAGLSNSHLVNKVKSYFTRSALPVAASSTSSSSNANSPSSVASHAANSNPYDQYSRMSLMQALIKDTAFLPAFLSPTRKSSSASPSSSSSAAASASNKAQSMAGANSPSARMQVDAPLSGPLTKPKQMQQQQAPATGSGYGLNRIAHALLDSLTSGISQRSAAAPSHNQATYGSQDSLASATTSLLSDIMSSYSANAMSSQVPAESNQQQQQQQQHDSQKQHYETAANSQQQQTSGGQEQTASAQVASNRSSASDADDEPQAHLSPAAATSGQAQAAATASNKQPASTLSAAPKQPADQQASVQPQASHHQQQLVRKTRSIGLEYPIESNQVLASRVEQQPSKASQINNIVDFVSDSYTHNRLLFNLIMNQVGLSQAVPYVEQILASGGSSGDHN